MLQVFSLLPKISKKCRSGYQSTKRTSAKSKPEELKALFEKALPDYDRDRFYVSHMKKVVEWYNALKNHASLDFVTPEEAEQSEDQE